MDSNDNLEGNDRSRNQAFCINMSRDGRSLHDEQANYPCKDILAADEYYLLSSLAELCDDQTGPGVSATRRFLSEPGRPLFSAALRWLSFQKYDYGAAYYIASTIFMKISFDPRQQDIPEPYKSSLMEDVLEALAQNEAERDTIHVSMDASGTEIVRSPYKILPRRIWDVRSNRVIPFSLLTISKIYPDPDTGRWKVIFASEPPPEFWAVSHSWTNDMEPLITRANGQKWPVPLPRGVSLNHVRSELLQFGARYVWLDVLCLRQVGKPDDEERNKREWKLDVPTIGNVYRIATTIVRYFNGLGRSFSSGNWDNERHWLNRAWTLQEIRSEDITYTGGIGDSSSNLWNSKGNFNGSSTTLRQIMTPLWELAQHLDRHILDVEQGWGDTEGQDEESHGEIYRLVKEMNRRFSSFELDKVTGLFYLLRTTSLPAYRKGTAAPEAWKETFHVLPDQTKLELLFDFPYAGNDGRWFPSWEKLLKWPDRDSALQDITLRQVPRHVRVTDVTSQNCKYLGSNHQQLLLVKGLYILPDVKIQHAACPTGKIGEYCIQTSQVAGNTGSSQRRTVGAKKIHFQNVYLGQGFIKEGIYCLITVWPRTSNNWAVCEPLEWSINTRMDCDRECICRKHRRIFRKIGVLRTDFVISLKGPDSTLERGVDCLFV